MKLPGKPYEILLPSVKARHKCLYGGRGGAKSWSGGLTAMRIADSCACRILFTREVQISIQDSMYKLVKDLIIRNNLENRFRILEKGIYSSVWGSELIFKGMQDIKSLEGLDLVLVEEAQQVSKGNAERLIPTVRNPSSQIWWFWNPENEDDWVNQYFLEGSPPPNTIIRKVNFTDNIYCPQVLIDEANFLKEKDYEEYRHIWLGELKPTGKGWRFINPLWLEHAADKEKAKPLDSPRLMSRWAIGCDPSQDGKDEAVTIKGQGNKIREIEVVQYTDGPTIAKNINNDVTRFGRFNVDIGVDGIGVGTSACDTLKHTYKLDDCLNRLNRKDKDWVPTAPPGTKCPPIESFTNWRSQAWWQFRDDLEQGNIDLSEFSEKYPDDYKKLINEIKYHDMYLTAGGKQQVTPKEIIKKKENLGYSPNHADALVAWNWVRKRVDDTPRTTQKPKNQHSREYFV